MNVDIIVPVLGRPEHARVFMESLRPTILQHNVNVFAICEQVGANDFRAWDAQGAAWVGRNHTFAEKVNYGYQLTDAEWVLLVGSDVKFHEGWIDALEEEADRMPWAYVIGTNDMLTGRVLVGDHTTHPLIKRSYIDEIGASWTPDLTGRVCCEEYMHCFVDDEIVTKAKQLGVWAPCLTSYVEHLHPLNGKGEMDEVYKEGYSWMETDRITWERRLRKYGGTVSASSST